MGSAAALAARAKVGAAPRRSNAFFSPWFGMDPSDNLNLVQPVNPWSGSSWSMYTEYFQWSPVHNSNSPQRDVEAGQTIWEAGDPASGIALVVSGRLRTSLRSRPSVVFAGGHDREVEPSGPGSLHGYLSAFTGHSHHLTFTALTDARLLVLSKARLDALPATAMLAVARVVMARSSHEYRHHTAVVANLMQ